MTETNYAKVLYELNIAPEVTASANAILKAAPEVSEVLSSPVVSLKEKENVIDKIFPKEICNFMKVLCRYHKASLAQEIFKEYQEYYNKRHNILNAELFYVVAPKKEQLDGMKNFLCKKYHTKDVQIKQIEDKSLIGGFCIRIEDEEIDSAIIVEKQDENIKIRYIVKNATMMSGVPEDIISTLNPLYTNIQYSSSIFVDIAFIEDAFINCNSIPGGIIFFSSLITTLSRVIIS